MGENGGIMLRIGEGITWMKGGYICDVEEVNLDKVGGMFVMLMIGEGISLDKVGGNVCDVED